jgi:hypothetical protein
VTRLRAVTGICICRGYHGEKALFFQVTVSGWCSGEGRALQITRNSGLPNSDPAFLDAREISPREGIAKRCLPEAQKRKPRSSIGVVGPVSRNVFQSRRRIEFSALVNSRLMSRALVPIKRGTIGRGTYGRVTRPSRNSDKSRCNLNQIVYFKLDLPSQEPYSFA